MFNSFFESAKDTIRRAGALDGLVKMKDDGVKAGVASVPADPDRDSAMKGDQVTPPTDLEVGAREPKVDSASTATATTTASTAASSLSWSFSRLKASGTTSVSKAMLPLKKALGSHPEATGVRASLVKYKGDLSLALAEATATATKRRDERDLLTRALAGQDNDLQSWGYLSVLPTFREHRRHETNRAQLRMSIAEQESELLSSKRQDVNAVLRSMPVIGPWTPSGLPRSAWVGMGMHGGEDDATGFHFDEKAFVVAPDVLLAMDEGLASKRQLLVLCDRECAAAAEALAEKVSKAGGLEPRSPQDRAEVLLSLLTRYHVLGEALNSTGATVTVHTAKVQKVPKRSMASAVKETPSEAKGSSLVEGVFSEGISNTEGDQGVVNDDCTPDSDAYGETPTGDTSASDSTGNSEITTNSAAEADPPLQSMGSSSDSKDLKATIEGDKGIKDAPEGVDAPLADNALSLHAQDASVNRDVEDETALHVFGDGQSPPSCLSVEHNAENNKLSSGILMLWPAPVSPTATLGPERKRSAGIETGGATNVNGDEALEPIADDERLDVDAFRQRRKMCEEEFLELMSDERTREGRLIKRFLIMLHAKRSPNTSTQGPVSACPDMPSGPALPFTVEDPTGRCCTIDERLTTVKKNSKSVLGAGGGWEQEAAVGPQVVKAFINYFSKDYLGKRFDVPDLLIPPLTELVESLVFRRARRVVFGYNRLRVNRDDIIWREKAEQMRRLPLRELGIPPEYIPTSYGKVASDVEQVVACGLLENRDHGSLGVVARGSASNAAVSEIAAERVGTIDDITERQVEGVPHESCPREDQAEDPGNQGEPATAVVPVTPVTPTSDGTDACAIEGDVVIPYECVLQEFGRLESCTTPAEMLEVVTAAMTLLTKEAARLSGSDVHLNADTLLPLLVYVLVQADLPRVHKVLNFLRNFRGSSLRGEQAYYVTSIEAAISFVIEWSSDGFKGEPDRLASPADTPKSSGAVAAGSSSDGSSRACQKRMINERGDMAFLGCRQNGGRWGREATLRECDRQGIELAKEERERAEGLKDLMRLGIFLDNHEVQEDTVDVLSSAGYL